MAGKRRFYGLVSGLVLIIALIFALPTTGVYELLPPEVAEWLPTDTVQLGLDLEGGMVLRLEADMGKLPPSEQEDAVERALEIIRKRVDAFGVAEPTVEKIGANGISVQLPGIRDAERAKALIGERAILEFMLVDNEGRLPAILTKANNLPAYKGLIPQALAVGRGVYFPGEAEDALEELIEDPAITRQVPRGYQLALSEVKEPTANDDIAVELAKGWRTNVQPYLRIYLLDARRPIKGDNLTDARLDRDEYQRPAISFEFNYSGSEAFREITGTHQGHLLAIVLDGQVISAPVINSEIAGRGIIQGNFTAEQASDLSIKLRAGALPVPLKVVMEDTIGPSLGSDSIKYGVTAALIGLAVVLLFMVFWYKGSGIIADMALIFNMVIIVAALAMLGATLTLPGIAGIILTIGMAVDANVLIFERIREERRKGKSVSMAVKSGYEKAFITILDANITTLITAAVLYLLGTGPIRGFAVTLGIGILSSMFTALIFTRAIFNARIRKLKNDKLSI